jgi:DnaK suppressor protein
MKPQASFVSNSDFFSDSAARYNSSLNDPMNHKKRHHFKKLLLAELRRHAQHINTEQARALDMANDDVKESSDLALHGVIQELALQLSDRESQIVADIDQALMRMREGSYGVCGRCGHEIDERRLEAMPTARYDADCQAEVESAKGQGAGPSL